MAIDNTRQLIQQITNASSVGENTATRVGNAMEAMLNDVKAADDKAVAATSRINTTEQGIANANQRLTTEEGINATQTAQIEGLRQDIQNIRPVTIEGDVVNNPDNVFLTSANDEITPKERTTSFSTKGHYIMRPTDNFAAKLKANYIHEIPFDVNLGGASVTIPQNAVLKFTGGKIANGSLVLQNTYLDGDVKLAADVAVSGTCANLTAKQSWFADNDVDAWHRLVNNVDCPNYDYAPGTYHPAVKVTKGVTDAICINGNGVSLVLDSIADGDCIFDIHPADMSTIATDITSEEVAGSTGFDVATTSGFNVGDWVSLHNHGTSSFSYRRNYQDGEFGKLSWIGTNRMSIDSSLLGNYKPSSSVQCTCTKFNVCDVAIRDVKIINKASLSGVSSAIGFNLRQCKAYLQNVQSYGFKIGIELKNCVESYVLQCDSETDDGSLSATGDLYGLLVSECQGITVDGGRYYGGHGIAIGGSYTGNLACVNRFVTVRNTRSRSKDANGKSLDSHGSSEYITFENNYCEGISGRGDHLAIANNICEGDIQCYELRSFKHRIVGNRCDTISIEISDADGGYTRSFDNWTPYTDEEKCLIADNSFTAIRMALGTTPAHYPNSKNVTIDIRNNSFQLAYIHNFPYRDSTWAAMRDLGGKIILKGNNVDYLHTYGGVNFIIRTRSLVVEGNDVKKNIATYGGWNAVDFVMSGNYIHADEAVANNYLLQLNSDGYASMERCLFIGNYADKIGVLTANQTIDKIFIIGNIHANGNADARMALVAGKLIDGARTLQCYATGNIVSQTTSINVSNALLLIADGNSWMTTGLPYNVYYSTSQAPTSELRGFTLSGSRTAYPKNVTNAGVRYFDTSYNLASFYTGSRWVCGDGYLAFVPRHGYSANRPTTLTSSDQGFQYYDFNLGKPIYWTGSAWKDATGATV